MDDHEGCRNVLLEKLALACANVGEPDMDLVVSTAPPIFAKQCRWQPMHATCPHGTTYWIEPTGEQVAKWAQEARHT